MVSKPFVWLGKHPRENTFIVHTVSGCHDGVHLIDYEQDVLNVTFFWCSFGCICHLRAADNGRVSVTHWLTVFYKKQTA